MPVDILLMRVKIFARIIITVVVICCCAVTARSQNTTNSGTEFWTAYMDHINGASTDGNGDDGGSLMSLYITSGVNTSGTITIADGSFGAIPFTVTANQVTIVTIPPAAFLGAAGTANKGIHVVSLKAVAIYAHIYAKSVSGATLLLPVSTLGQDYFSINYTQASNANNSYSAFIVIATEDNTTVKITPTAALIDGHASGTTFTVSLNKGELYQGLSAGDLTGTVINSVSSTTGGCTKIAVFSGSSKIEVGCNPDKVTSDNLFQQVYPTATWGKSYITIPLSTRNYDVFRIVLSNPATTTDPNVKLNGTLVPLSSFTGGYYEFSSKSTNTITADQPIQVVQYAVTQGDNISCGNFNGDVGDPEMIFLNPIEQTLNRVTLYSTGNYLILKSFINVLIKTASVSTFTLDGAPYTSFSPVAGNPLYSYAQIAVQSGPQNVQVSTGSQGTHTISAGDGFNAIAYGFGQKESYGYAAGTNLQDLNENITLADPTNSAVTQTNGCAGVSYKLELTLPYLTSNIVWNLGGGITYTDSNPVPVATIVKGTQTLYLYQYNKPVVYNTPGDLTVIATVFNPTVGACGNNDIVEFDFTISAPPTADFSATDLCPGVSASFTDKTNLNGGFIKTWLWDFGDNTTSALQNPQHLYAAPGNYNVTLTVTNTSGCSSAIMMPVQINQKPIAAFLPSTPDCANQSITFTDQSTSVDGNIVQWLWDFGDGATQTVTSNQPLSHIYANTGAYTVKLTVVSSFGCSSDLMSQLVTIHPVPAVDFSLPAICLNDVYAQFNDKSTIADGSEATFTYLWNFGDPNADPANPNTSTDQNPKHKYSQASNYTVTLTVTSEAGCAYSKTQTFTVNGDIPVATFVIENKANLCSSDQVVFDDQSTVNFGSITKIVWYFDYTNNPTDATVFLPGSFPADRKYLHDYGLFNSPLTKSYTIRMDVYSGITCVNTTEQSITINANPIVTLSSISPICQLTQPAQIIENRNGFNGTGVFSGKGVSPTGLFDPSVSGNGNFTINYTFTAQNGCSYSTTEQVVVSPSPTVATGPDLYELQGGQLTIPAAATGDNLTYQWTPSTGLDHDNILTPVATPAVTTTYKLVATNPEGCTAAAEITVNVLPAPVIPNAFTPNGDGINDTWDIKYLNTYPGCTVEVFNRWGQKLYSSNGYPVPWDGSYKGAALPVGTYYYIIDPKNGRSTISGYVAIIK